MCCLKYEQDAYEEILSRVPRVGAIVSTPGGQGTVMEISLLKELVKVKMDKGNETDLQIYKADEVKVIKDVAKEEDSDINIEELKSLED
jgi:cell fate regulator YaaT (PSP1 superfamily)